MGFADDEANQESNSGNVIEAVTPSSEDGGCDWSQQQQQALEAALKQFPKGTSERWSRIAGKVPGKNERECMIRCVHVAIQYTHIQYLQPLIFSDTRT